MGCLLIKLIFPNDWSGEEAVLGEKNTLWFTAVHKTYTHAPLNLMWFCNCLLLYISNTWPRTLAAWTFGPHVEFTPHPWQDVTKHMKAKPWPHMLCYIFKTGGKSWLVGNKIWYVTGECILAVSQTYIKGFVKTTQRVFLSQANMENGWMYLHCIAKVSVSDTSRWIKSKECMNGKCQSVCRGGTVAAQTAFL